MKTFLTNRTRMFQTSLRTIVERNARYQTGKMGRSSDDSAQLKADMVEDVGKGEFTQQITKTAA